MRTKRTTPPEFKHARTDLPALIECSIPWHNAIAQNPATFRAHTDALEPLIAPGLRVELGNCKGCGSTIGGSWASDHDDAKPTAFYAVTGGPQ